MRTTITLNPQAEALVAEAMRQRGATFKDVVNQAIISSLAPRQTRPFVTRTHPLGARVPLDKALALAAELDDAAFSLRRE